MTLKINNETCYIGRLIVHPDFQNQGIGIRLMKEIENFFMECKRFELMAGHKSERNLKLYKRLGYTKVKTEKLTENLDLVYLEKNKSIKNI